MARIFSLLTALALSGNTGTAGAAPCAADSGPQRVALLELYTSEGCDSCPPADRWFSELQGRGYHPARVVALAFHVDYWNYLGWTDPFSRTQYSERQKAASARNRARVVYTPQLLLNGGDYRRPTLFDDLGDRLGTLNRNDAKARISLQLHAEDRSSLQVTGTATIAETAARDAVQAWLALYENNLSNQVTRGENRGRHLRHDFVVRDLAGPFPLDARGEARWNRRFNLDPGWKTSELHVAAFVQSERNGDVLQALATPYCR
jgi:hypothetical protein